MLKILDYIKIIMEFKLTTFLIYTVIILLILLIISFIWDNYNTSQNKDIDKYKNIDGFTDQRIRRQKQIEEDDIDIPMLHSPRWEHKESFSKYKELFISDIGEFKNPNNILKNIRKFIKKGASEFSKLIECELKEEISIKVCDDVLNDSRYLVIFDTEEEEVQNKLKINYRKLSDLCHVDNKLLDFAQKKLDKMDWKCCELIYGVDTIGMTEKIYICDAKTRNIFAMEKNGKVYTRRFYKAVDKFVSSGNYKTELSSLLGNKAESYIKNLNQNNWADFTYRKTVDGEVLAYNIILKQNYTIREYKTQLMNLAKDVCNKNTSSQLKKEIIKYNDNIISWIGVSSTGFTIYIRL